MAFSALKTMPLTIRKKFNFECHYSLSTATKILGKSVSSYSTSVCKSGKIELRSLRHSSLTGAITLSPSKSEKLSLSMQIKTRGSIVLANCYLVS